MGQIAPEVVDALYRALLGRSAEPAAIEFWTNAASVDDIIAAIVETPQFQRRVVAQAAMIAASQGSGQEGAEVRRHARLLSGGGLTAVEDLPEETSWPDLLRTLPVDAISRNLIEAPALVLGPYAYQLAEELRTRGGFSEVSVGLEAIDFEARADVLVLTDPSLADALRWSHPHMFDWIRRRVIAPVLSASGLEAGLNDLTLERQREALHKGGFIEVTRLAYRPFGEVEIVFEVTHATAGGPQETILRSPDSSGAPVAWWLVADRVPSFGRP
jgi:hypothetical protein